MAGRTTTCGCGWPRAAAPRRSFPRRVGRYRVGYSSMITETNVSTADATATVADHAPRLDGRSSAAALGPFAQPALGGAQRLGEAPAPPSPGCARASSGSAGARRATTRLRARRPQAARRGRARSHRSSRCGSDVRPARSASLGRRDPRRAGLRRRGTCSSRPRRRGRAHPSTRRDAPGAARRSRGRSRDRHHATFGYES